MSMLQWLLCYVIAIITIQDASSVLCPCSVKDNVDQRIVSSINVTSNFGVYKAESSVSHVDDDRKNKYHNMMEGGQYLNFDFDFEISFLNIIEWLEYDEYQGRSLISSFVHEKSSLSFIQNE